MAGDDDILSKYGVPPASGDDAILSKYGVPSNGASSDFNPSPLETGIASLAPKGLEASIYGAKEAISAPWGKKLDVYRRSRDQGMQALDEAEKQNPKSALAGSLTGGLITGAATGNEIPAIAALGGAYSGINSKADVTKLNDPEQRAQLGRDIGIGTAGGGLLGTAAEYIPTTVGPALKEYAGNLAEKATGATRAMAEKFAPGAGRELLDRGIVKFGYSPKNIANAAENEMANSQGLISSSLSDLDKSGVKASPDEVSDALDESIAKLNETPGTMPQAKKLEGLKEDIMSSMKNQDQNLSTLEKYKRSYGNTDWTDPEKAAAQKAAYRALMNTVENKATEASPELAGQFKNAKTTYGLLAPIQEAAQKRSLQLNQSPVGGLLDMSSIMAGLETGHGGLGVAAPIARRLIAPRLASSAAVTSDTAADLLSKMTPETRAAILGSIISERTNGTQP